MFDHAQFETPGQEPIGRFFAASRNPLLLAFIFLGLSTCASAQVVGGSLGRQATAAGYPTLTGAAANITLSAVLPASVGVSVSNVALVVSVKDPHSATEIIRVPVTSFWHLGSSSNAVELVGYFESPEHALVDAEGHGIPSTHVEAA